MSLVQFLPFEKIRKENMLKAKIYINLNQVDAVLSATQF